ncbi:MAG: hypothetical protein JWP14_470 [Frankiales bacterium]|jgi:hypothetical protein|nr:hypothetical protein [Frankiales bacterium]
MYRGHARRQAALAVVALLLALLAPSTHTSSGTAAARVTVAVPDSVPAARLATREHVDPAPPLDAVAAQPTRVISSGRPAPAGQPAPGPAYRIRGAASVRGPPPD